MEYASLLVHLDLEPSNDSRLQIAGQLATRFNAKVIGVTASDPHPAVYAQGIVASGLIAQERQFLESQMEAAEQRFKSAMESFSVKCEWRQAFEQPAAFIARQSRAADLVITGIGRREILTDPRYVLDPSELVLQIGRPLLIVPPAVQDLSAKRVVVGWKNTRESRRAIWDSLPLLRAAEEVVVATVCEGDAEAAAAASLNDVLGWLQLHHVSAVKRVLISEGDASDALAAIVSDELADLLVSGAYGHSRLGEWIWGGVSQKLLTSSEVCCLMAH